MQSWTVVPGFCFGGSMSQNCGDGWRPLAPATHMRSIT